MYSAAVALIALATLMPAQVTRESPSRFLSRDVATQAGCRFAAVKGPGADTCVLTAFRQNQMDVVVYERSAGASYTVVHQMNITSWYWGAKLSFVDVLGAGTDWLVIDTEGMRGTGIYQRILLVIAWDGTRFRTVASESLGYQCVRPTSAADYKLEVDYTFESTDATPSICFEYELTKDAGSIGLWSDSLRWSAERFAFVPSRPAAGPSNSIAIAIRERIAKVREYSLTSPLDPFKNSNAWIGDSGLMDVLIPACVP